MMLSAGWAPSSTLSEYLTLLMSQDRQSWVLGVLSVDVSDASRFIRDEYDIQVRWGFWVGMD